MQTEDVRLTGGLSVESLGVDYALAQLAASLRFLLDITPLNTEDCRKPFLTDGTEPEFIYRDFDTDPAVLLAVLDTSISPASTIPCSPSSCAASTGSSTCSSRCSMRGSPRISCR